MLAAVRGNESVLLVVALAGLALVVWAIVDVARRPPTVLSTRQKAAWIVGMAVGWLVLGVVGGIAAIVYLTAVRRRFPPS